MQTDWTDDEGRPTNYWKQHWHRWWCFWHIDWLAWRKFY